MSADFSGLANGRNSSPSCREAPSPSPPEHGCGRSPKPCGWKSTSDSKPTRAAPARAGVCGGPDSVPPANTRVVLSGALLWQPPRALCLSQLAKRARAWPCAPVAAPTAILAAMRRASSPGGRSGSARPPSLSRFGSSTPVGWTSSGAALQRQAVWAGRRGGRDGCPATGTARALGSMKVTAIMKAATLSAVCGSRLEATVETPCEMPTEAARAMEAADTRRRASVEGRRTDEGYPRDEAEGEGREEIVGTRQVKPAKEASARALRGAKHVGYDVDV